MKLNSLVYLPSMGAAMVSYVKKQLPRVLSSQQSFRVSWEEKREGYFLYFTGEVIEIPRDTNYC